MAEQLELVTFAVRSLSHLLQHNTTGMGKYPPRHVPEPEQEARDGLYLLPLRSGEAEAPLYAPAEWFRCAILETAKVYPLRRGRATMMRAYLSRLFVAPGCDECPLYHPVTLAPIRDRLGEDWFIDRRPAVVQGNRVVRARPMIKEWLCQITFEYWPSMIQLSLLAEIFADSGLSQGVGDYSPRCRGPFGRYAVELLPAAGLSP